MGSTALTISRMDYDFFLLEHYGRPGKALGKERYLLHICHMPLKLEWVLDCKYWSHILR